MADNFTDLEDEIARLEMELFPWKRAVGIWELITFLIGVPANGLVAFISYGLLRRSDRMITPQTGYRNHHLCIFSISLADLLFTGGHCPIMFAYYFLRIQLDHSLCRCMYFVTHCSTVVSSLSLLWLNLDKFVCVRYPLEYYAGCWYVRVIALISVSWTLAIGWSFFFIFGPVADGFEVCQLLIHDPYLYYASFVVTFFVFPIILSLLFSLHALAVAIKARKNESRYSLRLSARVQLAKRTSAIALRRCRRSCPSAVNASSSVSPRIGCKLKWITFVFITTLWSTVTCLPYRSAYLAFNVHMEKTWLAKLAMALFAIMVANAAGNPFITLLTQKKYRDKANGILLWARWRKKSDDYARRISATVGTQSIMERSRAKTM